MTYKQEGYLRDLLNELGLAWSFTSFGELGLDIAPRDSKGLITKMDAALAIQACLDELEKRGKYTPKEQRVIVKEGA